MSFFLDLLKKIPLKKAGPAGAVILALITVGVIGYRMRWWQKLIATLGWLFWFGLVLLVVLAIVVLLLWLIPRYREKRFLERMSSEDETTPEEDVKAHRKRLQEKVQEAIRTLQNAPELKQKEGMPLYALPWYLLLGANHSGKTTLLQAAAKDLRTVARSSASGDGPTPDCDWWFFNTAIVLDTASAYAFPSEVEREGAQWFHFLELLRHYREFQPINGLIIAIAADAMGSSSEAELRRSADELRNRIHETREQLKIDFPVYVLVTRCDLIEGFTEFFDCLPERTLDQVFGYVQEKPLAKGDEQSDTGTGSPFAAVFASLLERLRQLRLSILNEEQIPPLETHQRVYCFPEEFRALQQPLSAFLDRLFRYDRFLHTPMFRGIFFSSAEQQGIPVSFLRRELHVNGQSRALDDRRSKPYFLHDLFSEILPRDQYLAGKTTRRRVFKHLFGFSACVGLCFVILILLTQAYFSDRGARASVGTAHCEAAVAQAEGQAFLDKADRCRQQVQALRDRNRRRLSWGKAIFPGSIKLEKRLREQYVRQFETQVLTPLDTRIARQLNGSSETIPLVFLLVKRIELIDQCRAAAGCPEPMAAEAQPDYALMLDPGQRQPPSPEQVALLSTTYEAYLRWASMATDALPRERQAHADRLQGWFTAKEFAPDQILSWANQNYKPVTLLDYWEGLPPAGGKAIPQVKGAYTPAAWMQSIHPFLQRAGDAVPSMKSDLKDFQEAYRQQYFEQWQRFLMAFPEGERPWERPSRRRRELARQLLEADSPYNRIVDAAIEHLQPFLPKAIDVQPDTATTSLKVPELTAKAEKADLPTWIEVLRHYAASESRKTYMTSLQQLGSPLAENAPMEDSFRLVQAAFQEGAPSEKSTHPVLKAWWVMEQFQKQEDPGGVEAAPFWPLLERPVRFVWKTVLVNTGEFLQQSWSENVVAPTQGLSQMEQIDFLYGPQGKVREFVDQFARPFLVENESRLGQILGEEVPLSPKFLDTLRDERLYNALFMPGTQYRVPVQAAQPSIIDSPINLTEEKTEFILECAAKTYNITNRAQTLTQASATVFWSFENCGDVVITIVMSCDRVCVERAALVGMSVSETAGLRLSKRYTGQTGFLRFIEDFRAAEHKFGMHDFADSYPPSVWQKLKATLRSYGIRAILVYFRVSIPAKLEKLVALLDADAIVAHQVVR